MITDAQFVAWLSQEHADRVILYEQDYIYEDGGAPAQGTLYLSDKPYAPVGSQPYVDCIASVPEFERSLGGNRLSTYSSSIGSVEIVNTDGELDFLLDLALDGSEARFYYGDTSWDRADFRLIFSVFGLMVQRAPFRRMTVNLKDSTALLNQSIGGDSLVGGVGPNANQERPLNFGFIHNLTPLSYDSINLVYAHSDTGGSTSGGSVTALEVRDDGVPVDFLDGGDGTLELDAAPAGLITCDVAAFPLAGTDGDNQSVSDAFAYLIGDRAGFVAEGLYDGPHPTFVPDDTDDYPVGVSIQEARNVLDVLGELTDSGNCFAAIKRDGSFTFGRLKPYDIESFGLDPVDLVEDDIVPAASFEVQHLTPEYYRYQSYAHKNWTVQSTLSDILQPDEKARFSRKGQFALQSLVGGTTYALAPELYHKTLSTSPPIETLLSWADDSSILYLTQWMETRRAMFLPWLEIATVSLPLGANPDAPAMFYALELGDVVRVTVPRFGYDTGTLFQVIGIGISLSKARTMLRIVRKRGVTAPPVGWEAGEQYIIQTPFQWTPGPPAVVVVPPPGGLPTSTPLPPTIVIIGTTPGGGPPAPEDAYYWLDLFSEDAADLTTHLPDIGSAYAADADFPDRDDLEIDDDAFQGLMVRQSVVLEDAYGIAPITPASANYWIEARAWWLQSVEGAKLDDLYLFARKTEDTAYRLRIGLAQGTSGEEYAQVEIDRIVSGSVTATFGTNNDASFASNTAHVIRWELNSASHRVFIDAVEVVDADDTGGAISSAGDEAGFGIQHDTGSGTYFDLVCVDSIACAGNDAGPEFQLWDSTYSMSLDAESGGVRLLNCPATGTYTFELHLINFDPDSTWSMGFTGTIPDGLTLMNFFGSGNHVPFVYGTFTAEDVVDEFSFQLFRDGDWWGPTITLTLV